MLAEKQIFTPFLLLEETCLPLFTFGVLHWKKCIENLMIVCHQCHAIRNVFKGRSSHLVTFVKLRHEIYFIARVILTSVALNISTE